VDNLKAKSNKKPGAKRPAMVAGGDVVIPASLSENIAHPRSFVERFTQILGNFLKKTGASYLLTETSSVVRGGGLLISRPRLALSLAHPRSFVKRSHCLCQAKVEMSPFLPK
jgi:hypothetical protein